MLYYTFCIILVYLQQHSCASHGVLGGGEEYYKNKWDGIKGGGEESKGRMRKWDGWHIYCEGDRGV